MYLFLKCSFVSISFTQIATWQLCRVLAQNLAAVALLILQAQFIVLNCGKYLLLLFLQAINEPQTYFLLVSQPQFDQKKQILSQDGDKKQAYQPEYVGTVTKTIMKVVVFFSKRGLLQFR